MPISVNIGDTLEREPTHMCDRNPAELIRKCVEKLKCRGSNILQKVANDLKPDTFSEIPKSCRAKIEEWCGQVPVLGFNSGGYDLNVIRNHFVGHLADLGNVKITKKVNKIMFLLTKGFRFLDIMNYLGQGPITSAGSRRTSSRGKSPASRTNGLTPP